MFVVLLLARSVKNIATYTSDLDHFKKSKEFRTRQGHPDLAISCYECEENQLVQVICEHLAGSAPSALHNEPHMIDISGTGYGSKVFTLGKGPFVFTRQTHHELILNESDYFHFLEILFNDQGSRLIEPNKKNLAEYINSKIEMRDDEWLALQKRPGNFQIKRFLENNGF